MQIGRLFEIVYLLQEHKNTTAKALAEHFEVSVRTILRDIDTLAAAGIPVYTAQGKGGGIFILDTFILNKAVISEEEQNDILFALQSLSATRHVDPQHTLGKLRSFFEKRDTDWIEVDLSRWGNSKTDREKFETLKNGVIQRRALAFTYFNSSGESRERRVYPLRLVFKSHSWYLLAYCLSKCDYRIFKVNRMTLPVLLDDTFDAGSYHPPEIEPSREVTGVPAVVRLKFSPHAAFRIHDEFDEQDFVQTEDGSFLVAVAWPEDQWLYDYILSFGTAVEVLEPPSVRNGIARRAELIVQTYKPD
ncbi:YafY family transcriptional regulator [Paenibacillus sp. HN-1]|uniref:helix-turn-helix transcriptional regulator n=1 Tax=Paenibacillus TaxID=44249 RepID=UPI001CA7E9E0|nr:MULTISPECIES: YafY family protein [Paenibacillus]MBY9081106.1 YafY family transcriptional regulator [Paenibacillus sp. CGMCC 1.18879]MBY9087143.1 YafY family transcriptional regulator [Paenibacillus sinensis]